MMMRNPRWSIPRMLTALIGVSLVWGIAILPPVWSQSRPLTAISPTTTAAVVVDGRELLRLGAIANFSAQARADLVNTTVQQVLDTSDATTPIAITTTQSGELTTLWIQGQHLLTATPTDFIPGSSSREQAQEWQRVMQAALQRAQQERSPTYYRQASFWVGLACVGTLGLHGGLGWWQRRLRRQLPLGMDAPAPPPAQSYALELLNHWGLRGVQAALWLGLMFYITDCFPGLRQWRYRVWQLLDSSVRSPVVALGETGFSLLDLGKLVVVVIVLWIGVRALTQFIKTRFLKTIRMKPGTQAAIVQLLQLVLMGIGLIIILQSWGIDLRAIAILASVLGVGIGFGLQHIANNLISGLIILFERPIQVGDFINLGELAGTVEKIGARSTEIQTLDLVTIIVPNSEFVQNKVMNWSHGHPVSRLHVPFGVAYGSTMKRVQTAVLEAAKMHPEVLHYPQPQLLLQNLGDFALNFDLVVWIREPRHQIKIKSDLYYLLEANLRRYRLEIPFPQQEVTVRSPQWEAIVTALQPPGAAAAASAGAAAPAVVPLDSDPDWLTELRACFIGLQPQTLTESEIAALVGQMRGEGGLEIKDRRYGLSFYGNCFVGSEAVDWLARSHQATREAAVRMGQALVEQGLIHHVTDEHPFRDEYLFYRFYADERESAP